MSLVVTAIVLLVVREESAATPPVALVEDCVLDVELGLVEAVVDVSLFD